MDGADTLLLVRHGLTDETGRRLSGRLQGVHLNGTGRSQARALAERLAVLPLAAIYSSPLERALETAGPLAEGQGLEPEVREDLAEVDFGEWTGLWMEELAGRPEWQAYNARRRSTRPPGGESMAEVQARAVAALEQIRERHRGSLVAVFSHGDVIRAAVLHYLGMGIDLHDRLEISPASLTMLGWAADTPRLVRLNDTGPLSPEGRP
jgi:probable phosphomutase (TIGR03848 family)